MNRVNICFLTDKEYCLQTGVALTSLKNNKKPNSVYDVFVLCSNMLSQDIEKIKTLESKNFSIHIINLAENSEFEKYDIANIPASITAIYKFSIPNILPHLDKVIYLDGDTIIKEDLTELYNYDLGDNYLGAVKDTGGLSRTFYRLCAEKVFYFNSGVLLMNLKTMRENNIPDKLIEYRKHGYNDFMDQDSLNYILRNRVRELPFRYNTQLAFISANLNIDKVRSFYGLSVVETQNVATIVNSANIIHFSGKRKPWKHIDGPEHETWIQYFNNSPFKHIKLKRNYYIKPKVTLLDSIRQKMKNLRRYTFIKTLQNNNNIV